MDKLIVYWYCLRRNLPWKKEEARGETGEMQMVKTKRGLQMGAVDMETDYPVRPAAAAGQPVSAAL